MSKNKKSVKPSAAKAKKTLPVVKKIPASQQAFEAARERANGKRIVLHIGCGSPNPEKLHKSFRTDEWFELRLDIDENAKPDIVSDMVNMAAIPDESVDAIWSSHNIEHLYPHIVPEAMREFNRVLKVGGHILATMPDIQSVAAFVANGTLEEPIYQSPAGPICPIDIMYGLRTAMARGNLFMAHKTAFTAKSLGTHLRDAGFCNITLSRDWVDLWAIGYKLPPGHPNRVEKMVINENAERRVNPPPAPPLQRLSHPGFIQQGVLTDELDVPPKVWNPLGLKKQSS